MTAAGLAFNSLSISYPDGLGETSAELVFGPVGVKNGIQACVRRGGNGGKSTAIRTELFAPLSSGSDRELHGLLSGLSRRGGSIVAEFRAASRPPETLAVCFDFYGLVFRSGSRAGRSIGSVDFRQTRIPAEGPISWAVAAVTDGVAYPAKAAASAVGSWEETVAFFSGHGIALEVDPEIRPDSRKQFRD